MIRDSEEDVRVEEGRRSGEEAWRSMMLSKRGKADTRFT
jgi:hypothetical protein